MNFLKKKKKKETLGSMKRSHSWGLTQNQQKISTERKNEKSKKFYLRSDKSCKIDPESTRGPL